MDNRASDLLVLVPILLDPSLNLVTVYEDPEKKKRIFGNFKYYEAYT